jgi:hypothetical protein
MVFLRLLSTCGIGIPAAVSPEGTRELPIGKERRKLEWFFYLFGEGKKQAPKQAATRAKISMLPGAYRKIT